MCSIVVAHQAHPAFPVIIAANRDEFYARPSTGPAVLSNAPRIVGGRDGEKGGTWLGVNEHGLFAGLTNQRTWHIADRTLRSRGEIVLDALSQRNAEAMARVIRRTDPSQYNAFNLLFGDASRMLVAYFRNDPPSLTVEPLPHGLHVLPNDMLDSREFPKVERARERIAPALDGSFEDLAATMKSTLTDHLRAPSEKLPSPPPDSMFPPAMVRELSALCIHTPVYGTRSASFVVLAPGSVAHYEYADGPPCEHAFRDVRALLDSDRHP